MKNKERDYVRSLWFTQGKPAEISAVFDRTVTRVGTLFGKGLGSTQDKSYNLYAGNLRYEIHERDAWLPVEKHLPYGLKRRMGRGDIVHVYSRGPDNQEQFVERKRVKDNPLGFSDAPRR